MTTPDSDPSLTLLSWNVGRASVSRFREQLAAVRERTPDIVALQEVGVRASRRPRELLREAGFEYAVHSHEYHPDTSPRSSGTAFASRWPLRVLAPDTFDMPAPHQALSAVFYTPFGPVEGHTVHVLPGSQVGETKVEMFEGIYDRLAVDDPPDFRFLCGDFNSPKDEGPDGDVTVWGSDDRWIQAERSVLVELADYDLTDAYRAVNGYGDDAYSFVTRNTGSEWRRRFDHVFASERLGVTDAAYLHEYDDRSDHTPLEVVFQPADALHGASIDREECENQTDSDDSTETTAPTDCGESTDPTDRTAGTPIEENTWGAFPGLEYEEDVRVVDPDQQYRRGRFKAGWNRAVAGESMGESLQRLTWENLGWRLGSLLGEADEERKEALYERCVELQLQQE